MRVDISIRDFFINSMIVRQLPLLYMVFSVFFLFGCETEQQREERIKQHILNERDRIVKDSIKQVRYQEEKIRKDQLRLEKGEAERKRKLKVEREREAKLEAERLKKEELNRWKNNSLRTGSTPWSSCFGSNNDCDSWGCSQIEVKTPRTSDVLVTIKRNGDVVRHAYIKKGSSYTIELPNGTYQPFFYYGNGWNPNRIKKSNSCGTLKGGFISGELISKDRSQSLSNNVLTYELILQQNGNLRTMSSSESEAF